MTKIVLKHGTGVPADSDLEVAEVAIDNVSGAMYTKLADLSVKHLNEGGASSWNDLTDKPAEFPPESHTQDWSTITNTPADYPPSAHNHDGVYQPVGDYIEDANSDGKQYARQDGAWSEIAIPDGGTGSSVHIGDTPPDGPEEGQQWMEVPASGDATMWIYDGAKWLQHPGGKDGAPGADGNIADATEQGVIATWNNTAGQWTPDSSLTIDASGDATFSGSVRATDGFIASGGGTIRKHDDFTGLRVHGSGGVAIATGSSAEDRLTIDAVGDATFNENVQIGGVQDFYGKTLKVHVAADRMFYFSGENSKPASFRSGNPASGDTNRELDITASRFTVSTAGTTESTGTTRLTIDPAGNATFSGRLTASNYPIEAYCLTYSPWGLGLRFSLNGAIVPVDTTTGEAKDGGLSLGYDGMRFDDCWLNGSVISTRHGISIGTRDLIETLSTLRNATKDETTIKGLRDAIGNAVGGLIEKFEAMQASTQEISDE